MVAPRTGAADQAGRRRSWQRGLAVLALGVWACTGVGGAGEDETGADDEVESQLLRSMAEQVYAPSYASFAEQSQALSTATLALRETLDAGEDASADLAQAQLAWTGTWRAWQILELMPLGPAGSPADYAGGEGLRDEIYAWPSTNACRVDQELVVGEYEDADFFETRLVNAYGLDALEYLLFWQGDTNACAPQIDINADGSWDALGTETRAQRRADYAHALALALAAHAESLDASWTQGGYAHEDLVHADEGDSPYASADAALDELTRALFYADTAIKDAKLGVPGGISECASEVCVDQLESVWARDSRMALLANLEGFRRVYYGGPTAEEGFGFDDALISVGRDDLATQMSDAIANAISATSAVGDESINWRDALLADPSALDESHAAVKVITDLLKGEFTVALALKIPGEAGGDAD